MEKEELEFLKQSGRLGAAALRKGTEMIKPGASVVQILDEVEKFIYDNKAIPAFPAQISINNVAAHFCPEDSDKIEIKEDDVVKLDVGVAVEGYIADNARTTCVNGHDDLVKASRDALNSALKLVRPGVQVSEIGKIVHETIDSYGFSPVRNLSGHGLERFEVHAGPTIPNFDTGDNSYELEENDVIAIEPFASDGAGIVYESSNPTVFTLINEKPTRSMITRQVLAEIKKFQGFPFTTRWLKRKFGEGKVNFALREMRGKDMIQAHPPLLDKGKGLVSQAEHSMIVREKPIVYTKEEDD